MILIATKILVTIILIIVACYIVNRYDRNRIENYRVSYEYAIFQFPTDRKGYLTKLNELGSQGWDVAARLCEGPICVYLLLKREKVYKRNNNNNE